jgi:excisionase family DNA binding protein
MGETGLLTTGQVASALGTSRQHVVDLCDAGRLRCVRVGTHRRVPRAEVARLLAPIIDSTWTPERERAWWLHLAVLGELAVDPQRVLGTARDNIARWRRGHRPDGRTVDLLSRWVELLDAGVEAVVDTLVSRSEDAAELRANSPFAGVLDADRRQRAVQGPRPPVGSGS